MVAIIIIIIILVISRSVQTAGGVGRPWGAGRDLVKSCRPQVPAVADGWRDTPSVGGRPAATEQVYARPT